MILQFISITNFTFDFNFETISGETISFQNDTYDFTFNYQDFSNLTTFQGNYLFKISNGSNYNRDIINNRDMSAKRVYNKVLNRDMFRLNYDNSL